jgi:pimeloyl-ACP methyl ester carboxylesterase
VKCVATIGVRLVLTRKTEKHLDNPFNSFLVKLLKFYIFGSDVVLVGHSMGGALAVHTALAEKAVPNLVSETLENKLFLIIH